MSAADWDDAELLVALSDAFGDDALPVPGGAAAFALAAFEWAVIDEDLLLRVDDDAALVRADDTVLVASFESGVGPPVAIDISIEGSTLTGVIVADGVTAITVETVTWRSEVTADDAGHFTVEGVELPLRVQVTTTAGSRTTQWVNG